MSAKDITDLTSNMGKINLDDANQSHWKWNSGTFKMQYYGGGSQLNRQRNYVNINNGKIKEMSLLGYNDGHVRVSISLKKISDHTSPSKVDEELYSSICVDLNMEDNDFTGRLLGVVYVNLNTPNDVHNVLRAIDKREKIHPRTIVEDICTTLGADPYPELLEGLHIAKVISSLYNNPQTEEKIKERNSFIEGYTGVRINSSEKDTIVALLNCIGQMKEKMEEMNGDKSDSVVEI